MCIYIYIYKRVLLPFLHLLQTLCFMQKLLDNQIFSPADQPARKCWLSRSSPKKIPLPPPPPPPHPSPPPPYQLPKRNKIVRSLLGKTLKAATPGLQACECVCVCLCACVSSWLSACFSACLHASSCVLLWARATSLEA